MNAFNTLLTTLAGWLLAPLAALPPLAVLLIVSAIAGVLMTLAFGYTSNQKGLRKAADQIKASLLAMRLFKDDLGAALRCQGELFKAIGWRLLHSLPPLLVMIVPITLLLVQLAQWFEHRPLQTGEAAIVELRLSSAAWNTAQNTPLEVPAGVKVETPPLRDAHEQAVYWRVRAQTAASGPAALQWRIGGAAIEKQLAVAENPAHLRIVSVRRPGPGFWDRLLYPVEPAFSADSPVQSVEIRYPYRATPIFGFDVPWWLTFFIASMVFALLAKPFLKVQF